MNNHMAVLGVLVATTQDLESTNEEVRALRQRVDVLDSILAKLLRIPAVLEGYAEILALDATAEALRRGPTADPPGIVIQTIIALHAVAPGEYVRDASQVLIGTAVHGAMKGDFVKVVLARPPTKGGIPVGRAMNSVLAGEMVEIKLEVVNETQDGAVVVSKFAVTSGIE